MQVPVLEQDHYPGPPLPPPLPPDDNGDDETNGTGKRNPLLMQIWNGSGGVVGPGVACYRFDASLELELVIVERIASAPSPLGGRVAISGDRTFGPGELWLSIEEARAWREAELINRIRSLSAWKIEATARLEQAVMMQSRQLSAGEIQGAT